MAIIATPIGPPANFKATPNTFTAVVARPALAPVVKNALLANKIETTTLETKMADKTFKAPVITSIVFVNC